MSPSLRFLALLVLLVSMAGCAEALQKHTTAVRAGRRHDKVQAACDARDPVALETLLRDESDSGNNKLGQTCLHDIKMAKLLDSDCATFSGAFKWMRRRERERELSSPNPLVTFPRGSEEQRLRDLTDVAKKAVVCRDGNVLFGRRSNVFGGGHEARVAALSAAADGHHVYAMLLAYLKMDSKERDDADVDMIVRWLHATRAAPKCAEIEGATRGRQQDYVRASLLFFFARSGCRAEVSVVADELLASSFATQRADACLALREVGDKTHLAKMRRLADTDPARELEEVRSGFWSYAYVTHPVRETCRQALNQLELKSAR